MKSKVKFLVRVNYLELESLITIADGEDLKFQKSI
jgi:hypothetical protein